MPTFTSQPSDTVLPAYRAGGISFVATETDLAARPAPAYMVKHFINSSEVLPRAYLPPTNIVVAGLNKTSTFEIEAEDFCKKIFDLRSTVPPATAAGAIVVTQTVQKFKISLTPWLADADNILQETPGSELLSTEYKIIAAVRNHGQLQDIAAYTNGAAGWLWLTNKPNSLTPRDGHEFTAIYLKSGSALTLSVVSYSKTNYLDTNTYSIIASLNDRVLILGVGGENINAIPYTSTTGRPPVTALTHRYEITVSYNAGNASATRTYFVGDSIPRYVLHYINPFGYFETWHIHADADDVIEFDGETILSVLPKHTVTSGVGRWDIGRGEVDISKQGRKGFVALMQNLRPADMDWVSDLLISPLVYLEGGDGKFIPVVVRNKNHDLKQTAQPREIEIEVSYANTINSQNNYTI